MTVFFVNIMWAMVLFGITLWTTACVALNAALRRGMRVMGLVLTYAIGIWMLVDLPWREVAATWAIFVVGGGALSFVYELWARRHYRGTGRAPHALVHPLGLVMWPALIPDSVGLMFNDAGILPSDGRAEDHKAPASAKP